MNTPGKILVTGISGFTGIHLKEELEKYGWKVFGVGLSDNNTSIKNYRQIDIGNQPKLLKLLEEIKPKIIIHLAAIAFIGSSDVEKFYKVNLILTRKFLDTVSKSSINPEQILIASSANVYGNSNKSILTESDLVAPANDYAVSKLAMEYMAKTWSDKLPITIVRPFNYTGRGQDERFVLPKIVSHFSNKKKSIELGNIDVFRDFSDVRSVVQAYRKLIEVKPIGETINICSGTTYSLKNIITDLESITGHKVKVNVNPKFVRSNEVKTLGGDPSKLLSFITDWDPIPLKDTLKWMLGVNC